MWGEASAWKNSKQRNTEDFLLFFVPKIYSAHDAYLPNTVIKRTPTKLGEKHAIPSFVYILDHIIGRHFYAGFKLFLLNN